MENFRMLDSNDVVVVVVVVAPQDDRSDIINLMRGLILITRYG